MKLPFYVALILLSALFFHSNVFAQKHQDADASHQQQANEYYEKLNSRNPVYPTCYGGSFITAKGKLMVVIVGDMLAGRKAIARVIGSSNFLTVPGRFSYTALKNTMDRLNSFKLNPANEAISKNFNLYCLREDRNRIIVELDDFSAEKISEFKTKVLNTSATVFQKSSGKIMYD